MRRIAVTAGLPSWASFLEALHSISSSDHHCNSFISSTDFNLLIEPTSTELAFSHYNCYNIILAQQVIPNL